MGENIFQCRCSHPTGSSNGRRVSVIQDNDKTRYLPIYHCYFLWVRSSTRQILMKNKMVRRPMVGPTAVNRVMGVQIPPCQLERKE